MNKSQNDNTRNSRAIHNHIDAQLLQELRDLGLVTGSADFSYQCGKDPSNYRTMKRLRHGVHVGTLALLAARFAKTISDTDDVSRRVRLRAGLSAINRAIEHKCALRNAEIDAMRADKKRAEPASIKARQRLTNPFMQLFDGYFGGDTHRYKGR